MKVGDLVKYHGTVGYGRGVGIVVEMELALDPVVRGRPPMSEYLLRVPQKADISFGYNTNWS